MANLRPSLTMSLIRRALREGWIDGDEVRQVVEAMLHEMKHNPVGAVRVSAGRTVLLAAALQERIRHHESQEKTAGDRSHLEALKAFLANLSPQERAELNRITLGAGPPPGGLLGAQEGGEGAEPPPAATPFSGRPAKMA
jgi:hypothetical protein